MIAAGRSRAGAGPAQSPAESAAPLVAVGIRHAYGSDRVLDGVDVTLHAGEVLVLFGPNGAGKSTLLRLLAGLQAPQAGEVRWWGHPAAAATARLRSRMAVVAHRTFLFEDLTAAENLTYYAELLGLPSPEARAREVISAEGLGLFADRPVRTFSRGMAQRLAICRAWLGHPELVLADEVETGLDPEAAERLRRRIADVRAAGGAAILVAHDHLTALRLADRYAILAGGRLADAGPAGPWRDRAEAFGEHYRAVVTQARRSRGRFRPAPGAMPLPVRASSAEPEGAGRAVGAAAVVAAVLRREARLWLRGRERMGAFLALGLLEALVFGFALDPTAQDLRPVFPGVLWTALLFAALPAFGRSFADEWANDALLGLRAAGVDPAPLFYAKCLGHLGAFAVAMAVLVPAFFALLQVPSGVGLAPAVGALALGALGFVPAASLAAAVVSRALGPRGGAVLSLVGLPLLAPGILGTVRAAQACLEGMPEVAAPWLWMLGAYALLFWALPYVLFPVVVEE